MVYAVMLPLLLMHPARGHGLTVVPQQPVSVTCADGSPLAARVAEDEPARTIVSCGSPNQTGADAIIATDEAITVVLSGRDELHLLPLPGLCLAEGRETVARWTYRAVGCVG